MPVKFIKTGLLSAALLSANVVAEEEKLLTVSKSLMPEVALKVAQATMKSCRKQGYQISVSVVDSAGNIQVVLRDQLAGSMTPDSAIRKARTAMSFRANTATMVDDIVRVPANSEVKHITGALMLGGGVLIQAGGTILGAVGVAGAPGGNLDDKCAKAGIETIQEALDFL